MTLVRLRYTVRKRGKLFWQPTPEMKALGFLPKPLGPEAPDSISEAKRLADAWDKARAADARTTGYPQGTFGHYYDELRGEAKRPSIWWTGKSIRTREDYERAWPQIDNWRPRDTDGNPVGPALSHTIITEITTELCEQFYIYLAGRPADPERGITPLPAAVSPSERYRVIKCLKILLDDMVVRLRLGYDSPAGNLVNPQPPGRTSIYLGAEMEDLAAVAAIAGFEGISLAIDMAWQTMFSPGDVRTLRPSQLRHDGNGFYVTRRRGKTRKEAFASIPDDLGWAVRAYIGRQDRAEADDTPIFRTREVGAGDAGGRPRAPVPYKTKDVFAKDFRLVREIAFPGDTRQLLDIRRSANVEADAAGADKKTMGELLANGLADSRFLEETYTPPTVAKARDVAAQRIQGRAKLAGEVMKARG